MLKTAVVYLVLVGVPLLGLFVVLRWGAAIEPPAHVGGAWAIERACSAMPKAPAIVVDQSGRFLRARLSDGTPGRGRFDAHLEDERLVGTIQGPQCSACPASDFVAGREKAGD